MPTWEYKCPKCGAEREVFRLSISAKPKRPVCGKCGKRMRKHINRETNGICHRRLGTTSNNFAVVRH